MRKNYHSLSKKYHSSGEKQLSAEEVESYLTARMPATYAATQAVFSEIQPRIHHKVHRFLDMGAGPGTGLLAAQEIFPDIEKAILVEKNPHMIAKGKEVVKAEWIMEDFRNVKPLYTDLVLFSYSLGEVESKKRRDLLERAWGAGKTLVLIEPGTPIGFEVILEARNHLIDWGGKIIAPCPHTKACPMAGKDWCHFSVRLERSKEHKQAKGAALGWEDEKFSYVAFSKENTIPCLGRIVRNPLKRSGHILLKICGQNGLEEKTISRKEGETYKKARKIKWGDSMEPAAKGDQDKNESHIEKN